MLNLTALTCEGARQNIPMLTADTDKSRDFVHRKVVVDSGTKRCPTHRMGAKPINFTAMENSIIGTIRSLDVGAEALFPEEKTTYIRNLMSDRLIPERKKGMTWETGRESGNLIVRRVS